MIGTVMLAEIPYIIAGNHRMSPHASQLIDGKQGSTVSKETYSQSPLSLGSQCHDQGATNSGLLFGWFLCFIFIFFFSVLGMERRVLSTLGKHSIIEPCPHGGGNGMGSRQGPYYWAILPSSNPVLRTFRNRPNHRDRRQIHDELGAGTGRRLIKQCKTLPGE